jgi:hypothetical protein
VVLQRTGERLEIHGENPKAGELKAEPAETLAWAAFFKTTTCGDRLARITSVAPNQRVGQHPSPGRYTYAPFVLAAQTRQSPWMHPH